METSKLKQILGAIKGNIAQHQRAKHDGNYNPTCNKCNQLNGTYGRFQMDLFNKEHS